MHLCKARNLSCMQISFNKKTRKTLENYIFWGQGRVEAGRKQAGGRQGAAVAGQARPDQQELVVDGALPEKETEV